MPYSHFFLPEVLLSSWFLLAVAVAAADPVKPSPADSRDWRLSDLRRAIKASEKKLPTTITGITIVNETTLRVYLGDPQPLSGAGAEATLTFHAPDGWQVTKVAYFDQ